MKMEINKFIDPMNVQLKELFCGTTDPSEYQILDLYECEYTGSLKAKIKTPQGQVMQQKIADLVNNMDLLDKFNRKTIRTLTYLATLEIMKPEYSITSQHFGSGVDDYILSIRSRHDKKTRTKSVREIFKDKNFLSKFNSLDANRIGYLAGVKETVGEFNLKLINLESEPCNGKDRRQDEQNFFENILACIPACVYWLNKENIYQWCNDIMVQTAGLKSRKEIMGKTNKEMIWKKVAEELDGFNNIVMQSRKAQTKEEVVWFGKDRKIYISEKVPLFNNEKEVIGLVGISVDITERKKMESLTAVTQQTV